MIHVPEPSADIDTRRLFHYKTPTILSIVRALAVHVGARGMFMPPDQSNVANASARESQDRLERDVRGFGVLQFRNYRLFFLGQLVSTTGMWMQSLAQSWLVVETLQASPFQLGLLPIFQFGPSLLFSIPAGTLVDRLPKRQILLATQLVSMVLAILLGVLTWTDTIALWHVYATGLALGIVGAIDMPTRQAFVSELVPMYALRNAIAINSATFNMGRVLGPAIAGVVLASFGAAWCFLLNGISYVAPIVALAAMSLAPHVRPVVGAGWEQIRQGLSYVRHTEAVRWPIILILFVGSFGMAYNVWLPLLATESFRADEEVYGMMFSAMGIGSLLGALSVAYARRSAGRGRMIISAIALGVVTVAIGVIAVVPLAVWLATLALALSGFCASNTMAMANTIVQTSSPDELRGRVMSVYSTVFMGSTPLSGLIAGVIADRWGVEASMWVGGGVVALMATTMLVRHRALLRQGDSDPAPITIG